MSSTAPKSKSIYEQWLELPDNVVGEVIMGDLRVSPRPPPKHSGPASSSKKVGTTYKIQGSWPNRL